MTQHHVDLNADMGEGVGNDAALLDIVSSANVACGLHAGSAEVMRETMKAALQNGVAIGAHPGFDDASNFGRTTMSLSPDQLTALVSYQIGAAHAVAHSLGARLAHIKLHGAMANMASKDEEMARICFAAAHEIAPQARIMVLAATAQERAARAMGLDVMCEIFADRAYNCDATLVDRQLAGAVIHDPEIAAARVVTMVKAGAIIATDGTELETSIDTVCLHGDTPQAVEIARAVRSALETKGCSISAP